MRASTAREGWLVTHAALLVLTACSGSGSGMVELPLDRPPAAVQQLPVDRPLRCPPTVAYDESDERSRAGSVPADFAGRVVLRCFIVSEDRRTPDLDRYTVTQWRLRFTSDLRAALDLPDRENRPRTPCGASRSGEVAAYVVDARRRAVRVTLPRDDPCGYVRDEVAALLRTNGLGESVSFTVDLPAR